MGTNTGQVMTLANSIIGVSILAMPFCFKQCGIVLSILMLCLSSILSRFACHFLLKAAIITRRRNYEFLAFHVFGSTGKLGVELAIIGFLLGTCIAFFVVMGDLGPAIISSTFGLHKTDTLRTSILVGMAFFVVLPLGLLKNVDSLSSLCAATVAFYLCLVLKVMGEATTHLVSGEWLNQVYFWRPEGILQCTPIFSMALFCQTQLFEIFDTVPNAALDKLNAVIRAAINMCTAVYISVGFFGYVAFSKENITGNILVSLSETMSSEVIKLGFVLSLAMSFPLVIFPCRASLYSLLYRSAQPPVHDLSSSHVPEGRFKLLTLAIVGLSLVVGLLLPNIERVLGIIGSTIGVSICIITPALILGNTARHPKDRLISQIIMWSGAIIMILGTYAHILNADQSSRVDSGSEQAANQILNNVDQLNEPPPEIVGFQPVKHYENVKKLIETSEEKAKDQLPEVLQDRSKSNLPSLSESKYDKLPPMKNSEIDSPQRKTDKRAHKKVGKADVNIKSGKVNEQVLEPPVPADTGEKQQEPPVPVEAVIKQASAEPLPVMPAPIPSKDNVLKNSKMPKRKMKIKDQLTAQRNKTVGVLNGVQQVNQDAIRHEDAESALEAKDEAEKNAVADKAVQKEKEIDDQKKKAEEQKLIETLKEHQEVQRDMLNEQQRILQELKKHEQVQHKTLNEVLKDVQTINNNTKIVSGSNVVLNHISDAKSLIAKESAPREESLPNKSFNPVIKDEKPQMIPPEQKHVQSVPKDEIKFGKPGQVPLPLAYIAKVSSTSPPPKVPSHDVESKPAARDILESGGHQLEREKRDLEAVTDVQVDQGAGNGPIDEQLEDKSGNDLSYRKQNTDEECVRDKIPTQELKLDNPLDGGKSVSMAFIDKKNDMFHLRGSITSNNFGSKTVTDSFQLEKLYRKSEDEKIVNSRIVELKTPSSISEPHVDINNDLHNKAEELPNGRLPLQAITYVKSGQNKEGQ